MKYITTINGQEYEIEVVDERHIRHDRPEQVGKWLTCGGWKY